MTTPSVAHRPFPCDVDGCDRVATNRDDEGNVFCEQHGREGAGVPQSEPGGKDVHYDRAS